MVGSHPERSEVVVVVEGKVVLKWEGESLVAWVVGKVVCQWGGLVVGGGHGWAGWQGWCGGAWLWL